MRWQIEDFVFCDQQQTLTRSENEQSLEPILVELLSHFCQHPDVILSRDELITAVWLGRTVTDSAVNRAITKLRKHFGDSLKAPRFIATFPKKGYKFVANVQPITAEQDLSESKPKKRKRPFLIYIALVVPLFVAVLFLWYQPTGKESTVMTELKPLTSALGQESHPRISPNQQYLTYSELSDGIMRLYVKQLSNSAKIEVRPVDDDEAWIGPASWNKAGDKLVYLVAKQGYCRYYLQSFNDMVLGDAELIYNCAAGSFGKIAFTHNDDVLIFAERANSQLPYELFEYNLTTEKRRKINQPPLFLGGNLSFDLHPTQNKLLVSSPTKELWLGFYSVDLDTNAMSLLFELDAYICCGIWNHSGDRVVLMGEHPAVQLVSYDLNGQDRQVVFAGSQRLYAPERHPNGEDYLFPVGKGNLDIGLFLFSSGQPFNVANSSVDDRLATVSPAEDKIAYIGLSSGTEELWLADLSGNNHRKISQFNDQRHFLDLAFSPGGKKLAGLTLNEIHIIDLETYTHRKLKIPQTEIRSVSFKDEQTIYYSVKQDNEWVVKNYNLETDEANSIGGHWQFVRFENNDSNTLWLDRLGNLYQGSDQIPISIPRAENLNIMTGARFNLRKLEDNWYWQRWHNDHYQLLKTDEHGHTSQITQNSSPNFDVFSKGVLFHSLESRETDIVRTKNATN
ncbi:winged helix-turn-helix domain-containing protein [Alteromonas facilis]|uniref:winged helix-turn-helix domain-containing protein n=1 Tax=Alteromonas facilis TaxID=2048004 RepID=UPI000C2947E0|nr:transcriptional regulator [Alteromonas facilis]